MPENTNNKVIATGNIPNTDINVNINADNSVNIVSKTSAHNSNRVVFSKNIIDSISAIYDSVNNKVIIAYSNSGYGTAIVGSVEDNTIVFGNPVVFNSGSTSHISTTYDPINNKIIIAYRDYSNSSYGTAIIGTIKNNSIIFSNPLVFNSGKTYCISITYDTINNKVIIAYQNASNSGYGTAIVGTVNNNNFIIFGKPTVFNNSTTYDISTTYDTVNNKVIIAYQDAGNSNYGTAIVGTVEDNTITFGDPVVFSNNYTIFISAIYDSINNKVVIAYINVDKSDYGMVVIGTVSGTNIFFGTPVVFNTSSTDYISAAYDTINNKVIIVYCDVNNSECGTTIVGTVKDNSILFNNKIIFSTDYIYYTSIAYTSTSNKLIIAYSNKHGLNCGVVIV